MSVVVVGSVNRDVVARVVRIPAAGETVLSTGLSRSGGGKGANQAVAAARAGAAPTAIVGAVGDDADGVELRAALAADGIDVSALETAAEPTGTALISVADDGENAIVVAAGANASRDRLSDMQRAVVRRARVLVTQLEVPVGLVRDAALARPRQAWHVHNAAPSAPFAAARDELLRVVDVLVVNEHELREAAGVDSFDEALAALAARLPAVVVTLGAAGALVAVADARARVASFPAAAVDTTGAGDTFCGVLAASLDRSGSLPPADGGRADLAVLVAAAQEGAAAAALAVQRAGAQHAVPTRVEVVALVAG